MRMQGRNRLTWLVPTILLALVGVRFASAELSYEGSSTIADGVIQDAARVFTRKTGVPFGRIGIAGSAYGIPLVTQGKVAIGGLSRSLTPTERQAAIFHQTIGYDTLTVTVHADNPVGALTRERLKSIYTGRIRNWREVGGRHAPIVLITQQVSKGRGQIVEVQRHIMDGAPYRADRHEVANPSEQVQALLGERDGLTVVARPYLTQGLKPVAIEGYCPTSTTSDQVAASCGAGRDHDPGLTWDNLRARAGAERSTRLEPARGPCVKPRHARSRALGPGPAASHEVDDQGNDREDDEKVDQATRDV